MRGYLPNHCLWHISKCEDIYQSITRVYLWMQGYLPKYCLCHISECKDIYQSITLDISIESQDIYLLVRYMYIIHDVSLNQCNDIYQSIVLDVSLNAFVAAPTVLYKLYHILLGVGRLRCELGILDHSHQHVFQSVPGILGQILTGMVLKSETDATIQECNMGMK